MTRPSSVGQTVLAEAIATFRSQKDLAERAVAQVSDSNLHVALDANTNSVAVILKHIAGNLLSRWTDFLSSDGEKPWRKRDGEFVEEPVSRAEIMERWEKGWTCLFEALAKLREDDLTKVVTIRGEPHTVVKAILRTAGHLGYHVGQIVQLARHLAGDRWTTLSIPRGHGESERYNERTRKT